MKLLETITEYAKQVPGTVALNARAYDRYKRYSFDFDQKNFKLDFTNGVLIYKSIKGARANPQSPGLHDAQPERDDLGRRHRGARRNRARRLDEAGRQRRPAVGQGDPRLPRRRATTRSSASSIRSGTASACR